ncbi:MAG: energy-coupling factor transporter transmembrane protein EcfT, partial [Clostridia bacterium]|nr:energy-coupling factor transporter transmembrane protein EcfT [Clostridia bacterium]
MRSDITFGQYVEGDSLIHRLDPRVKILISLVFIVVIFLARSLTAFVLLTAAALVFVLMTKIPPRLILKAMKPLMFIIVFTAVINI